jgi:hypothetical protein
MTQEEFINNVMELNPSAVVKLTEREWQLIETVYTYHPAIDDKKSMAGLYLDYGMSVITDMYLRAIKLRDMERQITRQEEELNRLKRLYDCYDRVDSIETPWEDN